MKTEHPIFKCSRLNQNFIRAYEDKNLEQMLKTLRLKANEVKHFGFSNDNTNERCPLLSSYEKCLRMTHHAIVTFPLTDDKRLAYLTRLNEIEATKNSDESVSPVSVMQNLAL